MAKRTLTDAAIAKLSYEQAVEKIEDILESVETGETGLEDALAECEDGAKLLKHCRSILDRVETRVAQLTAGADGRLVVDGLAVDEDGVLLDDDSDPHTDLEDEDDDLPI